MKELINQWYGEWSQSHEEGSTADAFIAGAYAVIEYLKEHNRI